MNKWGEGWGIAHSVPADTIEKAKHYETKRALWRITQERDDARDAARIAWSSLAATWAGIGIGILAKILGWI